MSLIHVNDAVTFFLNRTFQKGEDLTVTKLQKLLYYAQGIALAVVGVPLFDADFQAWDFGPVCPAVYNKFKKKGKDYFLDAGQEPAQGTDASKILNATWKKFGGYNASVLSQMTHEETPWLETPRQGLISNEIIKAYFKGIVHHANKSTS